MPGSVCRRRSSSCDIRLLLQVWRRHALTYSASSPKERRKTPARLTGSASLSASSAVPFRMREDVYIRFQM